MNQHISLVSSYLVAIATAVVMINDMFDSSSAIMPDQWQKVFKFPPIVALVVYGTLDSMIGNKQHVMYLSALVFAALFYK